MDRRRFDGRSFGIETKATIKIVCLFFLFFFDFKMIQVGDEMKALERQLSENDMSGSDDSMDDSMDDSVTMEEGKRSKKSKEEEEQVVERSVKLSNAISKILSAPSEQKVACGLVI